MGHTDHPFRALLITAALGIAEESGWKAVTRDRVAERAGLAAGTVNLHFGTIEHLRNAVMEEAVRNQVLEVIAQGLTDRHPAARAAPVELKRRALDLML